MRISILISTLSKQTLLQVDDNKKLVLYNGEKKNIDYKKLIADICLLTSTWKSEYTKNSYIDGESFEIIIDDNEKKFTYRGKNSFPNDYSSLKEILAEVGDA